MGDGGVACVVSSSSSHVMARRFMYYNGTLRSSLQFPDRSPEKSSLDKKMEMKGKEEIEDGEVVPEYRRSYGDSRRKRFAREDSEQLTRRQSYEHKDLGSKSRRISEDNNHSSGFSSSRNYKESQENRYGRHHDYRDHRAQSPVSLERRYERNSIRSSPENSERRGERSARSPNNSDRRHDHRIRSPTKTGKRYDRRDRSPMHSSRRHDHRIRSPTNQDKRADHRIRSPSNSEKRRDHRIRSPNNLDKQHEQRERSPPNNTERSPRCPDSREKESKEKTARKNSCGDEELEKDSQKSSGGLSAERSLTDDKRAKEKKSSSPNFEEKSASPTDDLVGDTPADELESMEEDMDICDSPPYIAPEASNNLNASVGNWFYIDCYGVDKGPSQLSHIKKMVDDGLMVSDHMIKHTQSDRWVTVENAVSPLVTMSSLSVVSDTVTQLASPPEASGNVLTESGDSTPAPISAKMKSGACLEIDLNAPADYCVDERVEELMKGFSLVPGREVEVIAEALLSMPDSADMEVLIGPWDFSLDWSRHITDEGYYRGNEMKSSSLLHGASSVAPPERYLFTGRWSCQGGDWKRNDEGSHDRQFKRKIVLNDGYPLCEMPRSSHPDPRWHRPEIYNSHFRRLEIPPWAYNWHEDCSDNEQQQTDDHVEASTAQETSGSVGQDSTNNFHASSSQPNLGVITNSENKSVAATRPSQNRLLSPKVPPKGLIQPVVRGNASMFKNHASVIKELHKKLQQRVDGQSSHSSKSHAPAACDSIENGSETNVQETDMKSVTKSGDVDYMVMDRVLTVDELNLHQGNWYYLDGAGRERGPFEFSWLQALVTKGDLPANSSAYRKLDNIWVPIMMNSSQLPRLSHGLQYSGCVSAAMGTMPVINCLQHIQRANHSLVPILPEAPPDMSNNVGAFHFKHPHFVGYTRGRLHELVMSSFRKRDFVTAINEVLDPWLNMKQPKKADLPLEAYVARKASQGEQGGNDDQEESLGSMSFDALCGSTFKNESNMHPAAQSQSWGLLEDQFLARVFHYLRADLKSLACSAATCKHWNNAAKIYKNLSKHVDVSQLASNCTDSIFLNIMRGYCKEKILCIDLTGCSHVSAGALEAVLRMFPSIRSVFMRGCGQFAGLAQKFPTVKWRNNSLCATDGLRDKSLRQGAEKSTSWAFKGLDGYLDDNNKTSRRPGDYYTSFDNFSNRSRYFGSRKYKSGLSQTGRMKGVFASKALPLSVRRYMQKQNTIDLGLKEIMEGNVFEFFMPKVAEIQNRMSNGYYLEHGLKSVTDDISRMCRDALKVSSRTDGDIMNIIKQFMKLVMSLGQNSKTPDRSDEMEKASKEGSVSGRKKLLKKIDEKKGLKRSGSSYGNGVADLGDAASERERRRLARLSRRSMDSESETSNDSELSPESKDDQDDEYDSRADPDFDSDDEHGKQVSVLDSMVEDREWGARMTKASLVPPVTRKYEPIDRYVIVADKEDVQRKMRVALPDDYVEKLAAQKESGDDSSQLPEVKDYKPRKKLGSEVIEQEVYGIDPYTHNLLLDSVPDDLDWPLSEKHDFIEEVLLPSLNKQVRHFTGTGNAPMEYPLKPVIEEILKDAEKIDHTRYAEFARVLLTSMKSRPDDQYVAYRKGLGVVCNNTGGFGVDDFVVEFLGEVYPTWKWYEKQDGIRSLQKNKTDPAPEFYNIYLERPKGDRDGYDLVVVDAMHKANYASRICHSCLPNCEAKVTAVDGHYQIGIYTVKPIGNGEEVTFDYNSVTESKEEYEKSVCLCGSKFCRGSYLNLTGEGAFQMIMKEFHGVLDRHKLMLEACESSSVADEDYDVLAKAGFGTCLLCALPNWLIAYSARLVRYINFERTKLPEEIFKYNLEEKKKFFTDIDIEGEKEEAQVHADGVYNQRLQNLAVTLDKVRYVLRSVFEDSKKAPPPLQRPKPEVLVSLLWRGEGSLVEELLQCMASNVDEDLLNDLKTKIHARDPCASDDIRRSLRECLLWLRDELRSLPSSSKCRNDAAADLIHMYAYTNCFFTVREYKSFTSEPVYISPLDLGPKYADTMGPGFQEYRKSYGENYCLGQLIYWYNQSYSNPDSNLVRARRGCLSFPQLSSFYGRTKKLSRKSVYSQKTLRLMTSVMEKQPQRPWPKDQIWVFKSKQRVFGSPMMDAVMNGSSVDREMMQWLKTRPTMHQ